MAGRWRTPAILWLIAGILAGCPPPRPDGSRMDRARLADPPAGSRVEMPIAPPPSPLLVTARAVFGSLPGAMPGSDGDSPALVALGAALFSEPALSAGGSLSCHSCHPVDRRRPGADNLPRTAVAPPGRRNAPTVLNAGFQPLLCWDGRVSNLAAQVRESLQSPKEMGPDPGAAIGRVTASEAYQGAFSQAFPGESPPWTLDHLARALAAYQRTLVSSSRFDLFLQGDEEALAAGEKAGLRLFVQIGCAQCHHGPLLGGTLLQMVGIRGAEEAGGENDDSIFKVPQLRNVGLTPPYFHDGRIETLPESVAAMAALQLGRELRAEESGALLAFLFTLSDRERSGEPAGNDRPPDTPALQHVQMSGAANELIAYGRAIVENTPAAMAQKNREWTGNRLSCRNCHLDGGSEGTAFPLAGAAAAYPRYLPRAGRIISLPQRINDCLVRSLHAPPLPMAGREMQALIAHIKTLPVPTAAPARGSAGIPGRRADLIAGEEVYRQFCQTCHGSGGAGASAVPPLWGPHSYGTGAEMHHLRPAAAFVRLQMPPGPAVLDADQAYDVAAYLNSFSRPETPNLHRDYPALTEKPADCPYPPFADALPADRHKYGPFTDTPAAEEIGSYAARRP